MSAARVANGPPVARTRLTYLMLFRVGLVTLLLGATMISEFGASTQLSPLVATLLGLIVATYALTIIYALVLKRAKRVDLLAAVQLAVDLVSASVLVHLTGGAESGFVFMYLLIILGASFIQGRAGLAAALAAVVLFALVAGAGWAGWLPSLTGQPPVEMALRTLLRLIGVNGIAFAATGALAARLAVELKQAGEQFESQGVRLRDLAALHEDVIRCLTSGLITVGRDHRIATMNHAAREILGLAAVEAQGKPLSDVLPALSPMLTALGDSDALRRGEVPYHAPDGAARTLGISLSPLVDSEGRVLGRILNFQDLTEMRTMERAMARSERLAAIGRLAAGIAHEIRNPLAAISGSIELLSQSASAEHDEDSRELTAIVLREVERLNALITELLAFARPRPPEPQPLNLGPALGEMLRVFENDKSLGNVPICLRAPEPVWVHVDPGQLRQVVWNLVRNAKEASPADGAITIEVANERDDQGQNWARLTVRDQGPGIDPQDRSQVFEPFFSTKEGGSGLGLATVHRIVEEHRGRIDVETPGDGGTAVTVRLPGGAPAAISE